MSGELTTAQRRTLELLACGYLLRRVELPKLRGWYWVPPEGRPMPTWRPQHRVVMRLGRELQLLGLLPEDQQTARDPLYGITVRGEERAARERGE